MTDYQNLDSVHDYVVDWDDPFGSDFEIVSWFQWTSYMGYCKEERWTKEGGYQVKEHRTPPKFNYLIQNLGGFGCS